MTTFAIVGSRYWTDYAAFCAIVDAHLPDRHLMHPLTRIISGGARGVDTMAERYARQHWLPFIAYVPIIVSSFAAAARDRNQRIVDAADAGLALPGPRSKGTYDTIRRAMASQNAARWTVVKVPE